MGSSTNFNAASDLLKYVTETPCDQGIFFVSNRRKCVEMR